MMNCTQKLVTPWRALIVVGVLSALVLMSPVDRASAQSATATTDTLMVYGPGGPLPAMKDAAAVFERQAGIHVVVLLGDGLGGFQNVGGPAGDAGYSIVAGDAKCRTIAASATSVAPSSPRGSRASISFRSGDPWQYASAGTRAERARLRAATVVMLGGAANPPPARSRAMAAGS